MATAFSAIPVIDFTAFEDAGSKAEALRELSEALFQVGFLYLTNTGLESAFEHAHKLSIKLFELPIEDKQRCNMINSPAFLGYTALGAETTASRTDLREQFDFGTPSEYMWQQEDPLWRRLEGPSQYPDPETECFVKDFIKQLSGFADHFLELVGECLGLPKDTFATFRGNMDRLKMIRYPALADQGTQGVGPHKDSTGLFTFLSQDNVGGLQVLNKAGDWINAPPIPGSVVVNIAQGFEAITGGVCSATTHRVEAPVKAPRYSIPYFLAVRYDLTLDQLKTSASEIVQRVPQSAKPMLSANQVASEFLSPSFACFGEASLRNRVVSHPDVGSKWYPELYAKYSRHSFK